MWHLASIGWKVTLSVAVPYKKYPRLSLLSITLIILLIVSLLREFVALLSCLQGIPEGVISVTIIALGVNVAEAENSFRSLLLKKQVTNSSKHVSNVISYHMNKVTIQTLLGFGLPWFIGCLI